jgi:NADH-quinone oxidoreductase subunit H
MMVTLFLGGWTLPFAGLDNPKPSKIIGLAQIAIFLGKIMVLMGLFIWVRWMWPRFRYDQLMDLGWRRFLPLSLLNIVATALWLWVVAKH